MKTNYSIKIHNKQMFGFSMTLMILAIIIGISGNNIGEFVFTTCVFLYIVIKAKVSYFTFFSGILWFSFLQEFFASINPLLASGKLRWDTSVPIYYLSLIHI